MAGAVKQYLWKQKIHRGLSHHAERWKMFVDGDQWLCPYCAKIGFRIISPNKLADQILDHFANDCPDWNSGKGEPKIAGSLKETQARLTLRTRLQRRPNWRMFDFENRWYCPYCAHPAEVGRTLGDKVTDEMVERVEEHLKSCHLATMAAPKEVPIETLKETVQRNNRLRGLVVTIRSQLQDSNELWIQHDHKNLWICPYCIRVVEDVRLEDTALLLSVAPTLMAQHLIEKCEEFQKDSQLNRDAFEFRQMVQEILEGKRSRGTVEELKQNLASTQAQLEDAASELDRAMEIQRSILPAEMPALERYEIHCTYQPAAQLGGDFYTFIDVTPNHLGFLMADVSGHGADAALVMSMTKKAFDLRGPGNVSPGQVLRIINHDVYSDLRGKHFVTAFYGILDKEAHKVNFSRAGHNYPLLFNPGRKPGIAILKSKGTALGFGPNEIFDKGIDERELQLQPGDLLLVYTDGLVEAKNKSGEEFDLPRVCDVLKTHAQGPLPELLQAILESVKAFEEGQPQEDDIALMAIRYSG